MSKFEQQSNQPDKPIPAKDWTNLDCLTHDFLNSSEYRQYCLAKYGQYMGADGRRVTA